MYALLAQAEPRPRHEASGVPVGSKNEFDLKHYIDDLKCFENMFLFLFFFQIGGGSDPIWKIPNIDFLLFLTPSLIQVTFLETY